MTVIVHDPGIPTYYQPPSANGPKWYVPRTLQDAMEADGYNIYEWRSGAAVGAPEAGTPFTAPPYWAYVDPVPSGNPDFPLSAGVTFRRENSSVQLHSFCTIMYPTVVGSRLFTLPIGFRPTTNRTFTVATTIILAPGATQADQYANATNGNYTLGVRDGTVQIATTGVTTLTAWSGPLPSDPTIALTQDLNQSGRIYIDGFEQMRFAAASNDNLSVPL